MNPHILEVGRLAITSNPDARDHVISAALKECQVVEETDTRQMAFDTLIQVLSACQTVPVELEVNVEKLFEVLKQYLKSNPGVGSKRHEKYTNLKNMMM